MSVVSVGRYQSPEVGLGGSVAHPLPWHWGYELASYSGLSCTRENILFLVYFHECGEGLGTRLGMSVVDGGGGGERR